MENFCNRTKEMKKKYFQLRRNPSSKCIERISIRLNCKTLVRNHVTHINQFICKPKNGMKKNVLNGFAIHLNSNNENSSNIVSEACLFLEFRRF